MNTESFEKLKTLRSIIDHMSIADKLAYVSTVSEQLPPSALKTSDGNHPFSIENILSVTLGALVADTRNEFEAICGYYRSGYRSTLREGLYNGKGDIPHSQWRKEIRRLFHNIRERIDHIPLPAAATY
jgi:hypothetical protein